MEPQVTGSMIMWSERLVRGMLGEEAILWFHLLTRYNKIIPYYV
jgi:hypothetical protein